MKRKRGISLGTVLMILMTLAVSAGCFMVFPKLSGGATVQIDAQQVVSALTQNLNLPELRFEDIPIFQSRPAAQTPRPPAPTLKMETSTVATPRPVKVTASPTATPAPQPISSSITAGGSVNLTAPIRKSVYHSESRTYDYTELFAHINHETKSDLCLVTLENTLDSDSKLSDLNLLPEASECLVNLGIDLVALGFPKALDAGLPALENTLNALKQEGFTVVGAYASREDAQKPLIMNLKGVQVAVLHYTEELSSKGKSALKKNDAAYAMPLLDIETVQKDIITARKSGAQVVIVSLNWGDVNRTSPTKAQTNLAQLIADAGADVILGAHSQTVQPVEYLTGVRQDGTSHQTLVAYSLGTLMTESRDTKNIAGMLLHLNMTWDPQTQRLSFDRAEYTPTYIWRCKEDGQYRYRAVASDLEAPEGMDENQQKVMAKILAFTQEALKDSPIEIR